MVFKKKFINIVFIFFILIMIILGFLFFDKIKKVRNDYLDKKEFTNNIVKDNNDLLIKISNIYQFPSEEEPTIATVSDPSLLKDQSFFLKSEIGDKVLFFTKAKKAILYRPSTDKILDIVSISSGSSGVNGIKTD